MSAVHNCIERETIVIPYLVELTGIEPATPCLQSRCSPN